MEKEYSNHSQENIIMENGKIIYFMVQQYGFKIMEIYIKENLKMERNMEKDKKYFIMEISIQGILQLANLMELVFIYGKIKRFIKGIFKQELDMAMENGYQIRIIIIKDNMFKILNKDKGCQQPMEIYIKESFQLIKNMVKVQQFGKMVLNIMETGKME